MKKDMYDLSEKYRNDERTVRDAKAHCEIRKKLDFIDTFRAKREAMLKKKKEIDQERAKLYTDVRGEACRVGRKHEETMFRVS